MIAFLKLIIKAIKNEWIFFYRFLVTYSLPENRWADDTNSLRIFDIMTGEMRRGFSLLTQEGSNELPCWPYFQYVLTTAILFFRLSY